MKRLIYCLLFILFFIGNGYCEITGELSTEETGYIVDIDSVNWSYVPATEIENKSPIRQEKYEYDVRIGDRFQSKTFDDLTFEVINIKYSEIWERWGVDLKLLNVHKYSIIKDYSISSLKTEFIKVIESVNVDNNFNLNKEKKEMNFILSVFGANVVIIVSIFMYLWIMIFTRKNLTDGIDSEDDGWLSAIFWPITLIIYILYLFITKVIPFIYNCFDKIVPKVEIKVNSDD